MKIMILHHSVVGKTRELSQRFSYPSKHFKNYRGEADKIIILGSHFYNHEDAFLMSSFIKNQKENIVGAIIHDDKNFGEDYASTAQFIKEHDIKVLGVWDLIVTNEKINSMEDIIDEEIRKVH